MAGFRAGPSKRISVTLPEAVFDRIEASAAKRGVSISRLINQVIRREIERSDMRRKAEPQPE